MIALRNHLPGNWIDLILDLDHVYLPVLDMIALTLNTSIILNQACAAEWEVYVQIAPNAGESKDSHT